MNKIQYQNTTLFVVFIFLKLGIIITNNYLITPDILYDYYNELNLSRIDEIIEFQYKWEWINYVLIPCIYSIKFLIISFVLYVGHIIIESKIKFRDIMSVVIVSEVAFILLDLTKIAWFIFYEPNYSLKDFLFFTPLSLLNFYGYSNVPTWSIYPLQTVSAFQLTYLFFLTYGLHLVINMPFKKSVGIVAASYGTGLVLWVTLITFLTVSIGA